MEPNNSGPLSSTLVFDTVYFLYHNGGNRKKWPPFLTNHEHTLELLHHFCLFESFSNLNFQYCVSYKGASDVQMSRRQTKLIE